MNSNASAPPVSSRRRLLKLAGAALATTALPLPGIAQALAQPVRTLSFEHTHTGERLSLEYAVGGVYVPQALQSLDQFLRDFRTGVAHRIEPRLFDHLYALSALTGARKPFQVISAYRSAATNSDLRKHGSGVASHSLHLDGRAIDVRVADVRLADLRDAALSMKAGGVGFYPGSNFIHIDTGAVRRW